MHSIQPPVKSSKMFQCSCERKRKGVSKNIELKLPDILEENNTWEVEINTNKIQYKYKGTSTITLQYNTSTKRRQTVNLLDLIWRNTSLLVFAEYSEQDRVDLTVIAVQWILQLYIEVHQ